MKSLTLTPIVIRNIHEDATVKLTSYELEVTLKLSMHEWVKVIVHVKDSLVLCYAIALSADFALSSCQIPTLLDEVIDGNKAREFKIVMQYCGVTYELCSFVKSID